MKTLLKIAEGVSFPLDIVTQTIAILAKRRAGKSYTMRRLVEQLFHVGQQVILIDPKGDQWGLRSSADGKKPGVPIVILGGEHGDAPLEVNAGEVVAKLVVEERVSVLLDLSEFRKHEIATFMTAFLENLYRLKAREEYRTPVMLVIDEADAIAPQKPQKGEERMLGAAEDIVRRGGQRGIGCALITQRSAVLNKNVLTQAQMLIVLRTIAPQDLAAMKAWIEVHGDMEQGRTLLTSLPSLPIGDAWFWSPGWPTADGVFKRAHVLPIETFDSGATPKPGERKVTPKNLADVDLASLKKQMAATIERAKADDPKALRKQVATLETKLAAAEKAAERKAAPVRVERIEVPTVGKKALAELQKSEAELRKFVASMRKENARGEEIAARFETGLNKLIAQISKVTQEAAVRPSVPQRPVRPMPERSEPRTTLERLPTDPGADVSPISGSTLEIMKATASFYPNAATRSQVATIAVVKQKTSTLRNAISRLRVAGLITVDGDRLTATPEGMAYLGDQAPQAPQTAAERIERWRATFGGATLSIFNLLVDWAMAARGEGSEGWSSRTEIAEHLGIDPTTSTLRNAISKLNATGVIETRGQEVRLSEELTQ